MDAIVTFVDKYFNKSSNISNDIIDKEMLEYCPEHKNEMLYYYCLDCGKAYCKTCFVFFGEEKDKHIKHSIIEYEKYKNMSFPLLKKNTDKLDKNIQHLEENIKRCLAYKTSYEHERRAGNRFIKNMQIQFNKQIDGIINIIDSKIKKLKEYINEYKKYKKEVEDFYGLLKQKSNNDKSCESLIIKLTKINQHKFFSSKELDILIDLSKNIYVNTYQTKIGEYNHENIFLGKGLKLGSSPYEIVIDNKKRNEVHITLLMPKDKTPVNHNFQSFIFIKKKGEGIKSYDLDEHKEDKNFYYLQKKIPWNYFGHSLFKIKGVLYDFIIS
jgi:prefoldin subunit 5